MSFYFKRPKPNHKKIRYLKRTRSKDGQEVLNRLNSFLSKNQKEPVEFLCGFWEDQQNAISYQELRMAVLEGYLTEQVYQQWSNDYTNLVINQFDPLWSGAIQTGSGSQPIIDKIAETFSFNMNSPGVVEWIHNRGSELVTKSTDIQREAINFFLDAKVREWYDPDQLARLIRPCIGLTTGQTSAAKKLYDRTLEEQRKAHPRTKDSVLQQRALEKTSKYAERAHRQRALTIAQTELAKAYNFGADESIRQAQENYLIGKCIKRWNTAGDDNVCDQCHDLDGTEVGMEETFYDGHKIEEDGLFPPLHPRCACAIQYIEVEPPDFSFLQEAQNRPDAGSEAEGIEEDGND